jgi:cytochrome bd-type quinol oxidase subunit 2
MVALVPRHLAGDPELEHTTREHEHMNLETGNLETAGEHLHALWMSPFDYLCGAGLVGLLYLLYLVVLRLSKKEPSDTSATTTISDGSEREEPSATSMYEYQLLQQKQAAARTQRIAVLLVAVAVAVLTCLVVREGALAFLGNWSGPFVALLIGVALFGIGASESFQQLPGGVGADVLATLLIAIGVLAAGVSLYLGYRVIVP